MNKINIIIHTLYSLKSADPGDTISIDEAKILEQYQKGPQEKAGIAVRVLSVFGGIAGSLLFLAFLFLAGLYESEAGILTLGVVFTCVSVGINTRFHNLVIDTASISFYVIGLCLLGIGMETLHFHLNSLWLMFILISLTTLFLVQNYIFSFVSVLIINGSLFALIVSNNAYNFLHVLLSLQVAGLVFLFLHEAKFLRIGSRLARLFEPLRTATLFSILIGLGLIHKSGLLHTAWMFSTVTAVTIVFSALYLAYRFIKVLRVNNGNDKLLIYSIAALMFFPASVAPAISGALLIILLSFFANYRVGFVVGVASLIYFVSQYYYDLEYTLLYKSYILMATGLLFLLIYIITIKKLRVHAKG